MKNDVSAVAKSDFSLIDENMLKSRIYTIRGVKVMLDADLAEIYGYETRFFNRQVKNNIERFAEDFRFQLTVDEMQVLMCKKCTSSWGGTRKLPSTYKHFLILNGMKLEADVAYTQIYGMAKKSIVIIDDYVGVKTLDLLRGIAKGVSVSIYSDEQGFESLTDQIKNDFSAARPDVKLFTDRTRGKIHDRYIFLDYGLKGEKLFHCGASSKDAGNKITTIMQIENTEIYHILMEKLKR